LQRRDLGKTGVEVPAVGLGTWQVLDVRGREEVARHEVVRAALEVGANLFDSSPMYGEAERVLGDALEKHVWDRAIVATKVWTSNDGEAERQVQRSLTYFGGRVELYQGHNLVALERRLDTLHHLKGEGKVRCVGATHYSRAAFGDLMSVMRGGRVDFVQVPLQRRRNVRNAGASDARARTRARCDRSFAPITQTHPDCPSAWC
jgi:aryl-alcohol dehydrogenase-like predicted oxidoreductase